MDTGEQKLARDVTAMAVMADEMEDYLKSDVLFWPLAQGGLPRLTLGAYLMRQHRLLNLPGLLDAGQQEQVEEAVVRYNVALAERIVRFEQKGHGELEARLRQWQEYMRDLASDSAGRAVQYSAAAETRAMIAGLLEALRTPPYRLEPGVASKVEMMDGGLRRRWRQGEFIWPAGWAAAYPRQLYWWLYGEPA